MKLKCVKLLSHVTFLMMNFFPIYGITCFSHTIVPAPHIITHPTDTFAAAPFSGVFTFSASGYGTLSVVWFRKDLAMLESKPLPSKAIISLDTSLKVTTNTLVIPNVTAKDVGSYYCVVWGENKASRSNTAKLLLSGM